MGAFESPFIVPIGAFVVAIVAIVSGVIGQAHSRRVKAEQRMAMLARGLPMAEIDATLNADRERDERAPTSPTRRMANSRLTALVLISSGVGLVLFGAALEVILQERDVLSLCAIGLVPIAIGIGFFADYKMQLSQMASLGMTLND